MTYLILTLKVRLLKPYSNPLKTGYSGTSLYIGMFFRFHYLFVVIFMLLIYTFIASALLVVLIKKMELNAVPVGRPHTLQSPPYRSLKPEDDVSSLLLMKMLRLLFQTDTVTCTLVCLSVNSFKGLTS